MKCQINGCEKTALIAYGNRWVCGYCMMELIKIETEKQNKQIEELENAKSMS